MLNVLVTARNFKLSAHTYYWLNWEVLLLLVENYTKLIKEVCITVNKYFSGSFSLVVANYYSHGQALQHHLNQLTSPLIMSYPTSVHTQLVQSQALQYCMDPLTSPLILSYPISVRLKCNLSRNCPWIVYLSRSNWLLFSQTLPFI